MDRGSEAPTSSLAPVPAYPRRAVEQYLADARRAWDELQVALGRAKARHASASTELQSVDESHRLLGSMLLDAQRDLSARRAHAEEAAIQLLASADLEAARILSTARRQAAELLGELRPDTTGIDHVLAPPAPAAGKKGDDDELDPPWPSATPIGLLSRDELAGLPVAPAEGEASAADAFASRADHGDVELWPARRPASAALDSLRWRQRRRRQSGADESYFSQLRDELRAEGTLNTWFEPA
ncbi:hypothetical protein [Aquihabitans sp. McL0605]|uniref:hypothetical protein n=1 Tax=Aquihabitans sp. McL0605 TaxID=3415671 RepID=UPI003CEBEEF4